jgi:hypothetical protein
MKKPSPPPTKQRVVHVGVAALARETGYSNTTVSQKLTEGKTPDQIRRDAAKRGKMVLPRSQGPGRAPASKSEYDLVAESRARGDAIDDAKLRRAQALAEHQELENMLRRGELMPVSYVRLWATRFLIDGRDELLKAPSELADGLAAESSPLKTAEILRGWVERAMAKFEQLDQLWKGEFEKQRVA